MYYYVILIILVEILKQPAPRMPVRSEAIHHWLAVEGVQPLIPENPTPSSGSTHLSSVPFHSQDSESLTSLPREMQVHLFYVYVVVAVFDDYSITFESIFIYSCTY